MSTNPILPGIIDSTMLTAARGCLQKFYNEFVCGLRPSQLSVDLHAGGVFASSLETYHRLVWDEGRSPDDALALTHGHFVRAWGDYISNKETPKTPDRMWASIEDYIRTYPPMMDHCQPYRIDGRATCEFSFAIPLTMDGWPLHPVTGEPFLYVGRADMLGTYNGRPCIRDEKTAGKLDSNWTEKWDLRAQFMGYCWAAQQGGIPCDTVIVRGVIITKTQIRQVEAVKFYPRWQIDRWLETTRRTLCRIVDAWNDGYWEYNLGDQCTQYGSCAFMPLCTIPPEQRENWTSTYEVRRWNPLDRIQTNPPKSASPALIGPEATKALGSASASIPSAEPSPSAA